MVFVSGAELIFFTVVSTGCVLVYAGNTVYTTGVWKAAAELGLPRVRAFSAREWAGSAQKAVRRHSQDS